MVAPRSFSTLDSGIDPWAPRPNRRICKLSAAEVIAPACPATVPEGPTIRDVLAAAGMEDQRGLAVAVDGEVVPRGEWGAFELRDGQRVEVLKAVQGG